MSMSAMTGLAFWPQTDVGRVRSHNEDSYLIDKRLNLFIVADGMGGHAAGEVASQLAARNVREAIAKERELLSTFEKSQSPALRTQILRLMESAVHAACAAVHQEGQNDPGKRGMGTTLDALLLVGSRGFIAHVGDSRIYLVRQGIAHQLTEDHTIVNELIRRGRILPDEANAHLYKNAVTRAVGVYESVDVDVMDFDVFGGDSFLLCTDGLHGYFETPEFGQAFAAVRGENLVRSLVDRANERGGRDNITAIVVAVADLDADADKLARDFRLKIDALQQMPLFRFLTYQELVRVLNFTEVREYAAGATIVQEGTDGDELFIVIEGEVSVISGGLPIARLGHGQHFGEMALVDRAPRSASVAADAASRVLVVKRKDFFDVLRKDRDLAVKLLWSFVGVLSARLRTTSRDLGAAMEQIYENSVTARFTALPPRDTDDDGDPGRVTRKMAPAPQSSDD